MFLYELHMHTSEGSACGKSSIHDMIRFYKDHGFAGAVVTDHFSRGNCRPDRNLPWEEFLNAYCRGYYEGLETAAKLDFDLLFGVEQGYGGGKEFLAYGFEPEFLYARPQLQAAGVAVWSQELRAVGGFLAYAHPFRQRSYIPEPRTMPDLSLADGVEVFNYCNLPEDNALAAETFKAGETILIAGSDLHRSEASGCCGVALPHRVHTSADLARALHENNFRITVL